MTTHILYVYAIGRAGHALPDPVEAVDVIGPRTGFFAWVDGAPAEAVRAAFLERFVPEVLRGRLAGKGGPLGPGLPAVRLVSS